MGCGDRGKLVNLTIHRPVRWNDVRRRLRPRCVAVVAGFFALATLVSSGAAPDPEVWQAFEGGRIKTLRVMAGGRTGFTLLESETTGVAFTNTLDEARAAANRVLLNGSGVALGDVDQDGRPDIFFASLQGRNVLYRNLGGWRFADITVSAGLRRDERCYRGATFADIDGDGAVDLLLAVHGVGVEVWLNSGQGKFTEATPATRTAGPGAPVAAMTLALADVDGNGSLDLYVANNRPDDIRDRGQVQLRRVNGVLVVPPEFKDRLTVIDGQVLEYGQPDQLYLNDGRGRFAPVSWTGGRFRTEDGQPLIGPPLDWGLTALFRDLNGDGFPDLYVCNDFWTPDRVWLNDGRGRFQAAPRLAFRLMCASSMGVDVADVDRDGRDDIFVVDMLSRDPRLRLRQSLAERPMPSPVGAIENRPPAMRNTLFHNRGDGTYAEVANYSGVAASDWSWSPVFLDVDLDGYEDLLIASGHARDVQDLDAQAVINSRQHDWRGFASETERQKAFTRELMEHMRLYPPLELPVVAFRNRGDGRFDEVTTQWGTDRPGVHHAMATADLDGDGDLDLVVNNLGSAAGLYRNETAAPRVAVRLRGVAPNTHGIGAKVRLLGGTVTNQSQEMIAGGRYLAGGEPILVFAPGRPHGGMTLEVTWRSGRRTRVEQVLPDRLYELHENPSAPLLPRTTPGASPGTPWFDDETSRLGHVHPETDYDDFARQPLLPWKLSRGGPGVAWFDLDGDGNEELIVGAGRGGRLGAWIVSTNTSFVPIPPADQAPVPDDTAGMLGWVSASGQRSLWVALSGYENPGGPALLQCRVLHGRLAITNAGLPGLGAGAGALTAGDLDGDGDLDLFVGGAVAAGRYPETSPARIYRCSGERLEPDEANSRVLSEVGVINGATWSDLDGDGYPELILACEWGPVRVFRNHAGRLQEATTALGLEPLTGWWKGVATGDLDGDGRLDIVAANWGWNGCERASTTAPLRLYFGDILDRGAIDLIETETDPVSGVERPRRTLAALSAALPFQREQFPTVRAYSEAGADQVLGAHRNRLRSWTVRTLATTLFLNRGDHFEARELPGEAQWAPATSVLISDLDGDGREDVFLTQNFFATRPETPRLDAGRGLWMRGDGAGGLVPVNGTDSGLRVYGEQRGAAAADMDRDGRVDLIISQNGAATRVFHNRAARPGLRVRLRGPAGNPDGVGAVLRVRAAGQWGPARAVQGGAGYASRDSSVVVLAPGPAGAPGPDALEIRWPGGRRTVHRIPPGTSALAVGVGDAAD